MNFLTSQKMYFGGNILSDNRKTNNVDLILELCLHTCVKGMQSKQEITANFKKEFITETEICHVC